MEINRQALRGGFWERTAEACLNPQGGNPEGPNASQAISRPSSFKTCRDQACQGNFQQICNNDGWPVQISAISRMTCSCAPGQSVLKSIRLPLLNEEGHRFRRSQRNKNKGRMTGMMWILHPIFVVSEVRGVVWAVLTASSGGSKGPPIFIPN